MIRSLSVSKALESWSLRTWALVLKCIGLHGSFWPIAEVYSLFIRWWTEMHAKRVHWLVKDAPFARRLAHTTALATWRVAYMRGLRQALNLVNLLWNGRFDRIWGQFVPLSEHLVHHICFDLVCEVLIVMQLVAWRLEDDWVDALIFVLGPLLAEHACSKVEVLVFIALLLLLSQLLALDCQALLGLLYILFYTLRERLHVLIFLLL